MIITGIEVKKKIFEEGDLTPMDTKGYAVAYMDSPEPITINNIAIKRIYFIIWDNNPDKIIGVLDYKIEIETDNIKEIEISEETMDYFQQLKDTCKKLLICYE